MQARLMKLQGRGAGSKELEVPGHLPSSTGTAPMRAVAASEPAGDRDQQRQCGGHPLETAAAPAGRPATDTARYERSQQHAPAAGAAAATGSGRPLAALSMNGVSSAWQTPPAERGGSIAAKQVSGRFVLLYQNFHCECTVSAVGGDRH